MERASFINCSANVAKSFCKNLRRGTYFEKIHYICSVANLYQHLKMDHLKVFYNHIKPYLNKYLVTVTVFVVFIVFVDENNVIRRVQYEMKIKELRQEVRHYRMQSEQSAQKLEKLHSSDSELERIAREDYFMKKPNEEVFIVE
jgi:cell division protein DivIC